MLFDASDCQVYCLAEGGALCCTRNLPAFQRNVLPLTPFGYIKSFAVSIFRGKGFVNFCQTNFRQTVIFFFAILQSPLQTIDCVNLLLFVHEKILYLVLSTNGELNILLHDFRLRPQCK